MEPETIHLIHRKKHGLLKVVFSRVGLMALLIVLQLGIFLSVYHWFADYFRFFAAGQALFSLAMLLYLFNCDMDATVKLTWLNLIMLFPVPATILLWFTRRDVGHRLTRWRVAQIIEKSRDKIRQDPDCLAQPVLQESGVDDLCRYLNRSNTFPIYRNTDVRYFPLGELAFEAMLAQLEQAEQFIFLEYFIIDEGYMWGRMLKILSEKAKQGVDVRVLYDGMCEVNLLPHDYPRRMAQLGIACKPFTPITPFVSTKYNYRDHRKILVIDGKVAFNGGVNLADEYINRRELFGHWKDTAVMLTGEAVQSFTLLFLQMWNIDVKEPVWEPFLTPHPAPGSGFVMPYGDSPLDGDQVGEMVYMDLLNRARDYVHIMTPYLILDDRLETALRFAAQRGVDVKLILPGIPDRQTPYALAKGHYRALLEAGVEIYEYTPGFVHAKVFVSDAERAVVGTINLDYRSLYHHFECATYLYRTDCIRDINEDFERTLLECRKVTPESLRKEKLLRRALGRVLKVIAPLM